MKETRIKPSVSQPRTDHEVSSDDGSTESSRTPGGRSGRGRIALTERTGQALASPDRSIIVASSPAPRRRRARKPGKPPGSQVRRACDGTPGPGRRSAIRRVEEAGHLLGGRRQGRPRIGSTCRRRPGASVGSSSSRPLCSPVSAFMKATRSADSCEVSLSGFMSGSSDGLGMPPLS